MTALRSNNAWVLFISANKHLASEVVSDLQHTARVAGISLFSGSADLNPPKGKTIQVLTAFQLLRAIVQVYDKRILERLHLVVCENLEQLDATYELGISLLRHATQNHPTRFVGFSSSLLDPSDLGHWLGVEPLALNSFRPRDRDQSLSFSPQVFTIPNSASLFKAMAKPAHSAIRSAPPGENAIVFVPSRDRCRSIARDLITQCTLEVVTDRGYLNNDFSNDYVEDRAARFQDSALQDFVLKGVGFYHEGLHKNDRNLTLELFAEGVIHVLLVPRYSCWTLPVRASVVVVMGTQYTTMTDLDHQLHDYSLTELVRMQSRAVRHSGTGHFHLFCDVESKDTFARFLDDGLPLESSILDSQELEDFYVLKERKNQSLAKQDLVDMLSFTFLARRITSNPTYYGNTSPSLSESLSRVADQVVQRIHEKRAAGTSSGVNQI